MHRQQAQNLKLTFLASLPCGGRHTVWPMKQQGTPGTVQPSMATSPSVKYILLVPWKANFLPRKVYIWSPKYGDWWPTCRLSTDKNKALMQNLAPYPLLQLKLGLLNWTLGCVPTADKVVCLVTIGYSLFQLDQHISLVYKRKQRQRLHRTIQTLPSTCQRDGIMFPHKEAYFAMPIKSSPLLCCPPRQRKALFRSSAGQFGHTTKPSN
jgi:hypothetical protein